MLSIEPGNPPHAAGLPRRSALGWAAGFIALALLASGCSDGRDRRAHPDGTVVLFAAASLRDVLQELAPGIEAAVDGKLVLNLGSSGDLARQVLAGAAADVFLSADEREMDRLAGNELVALDTRRALLGNRLVVIEPFEAGPAWRSAFTAPFDPGQLAEPAVSRLSLANVETVPAGRYAKAWLVQRGVWSRLSERVLPAIDARAALAAVESGGAQAGLVYKTDAARSRRVRVVFEVPLAESPEIVYPCAMLRATRDEVRARKLLEFLAGGTARAAFERHGFDLR